MGADCGLMVQSFNRKDTVIYVNLRNLDLGDQSHSALTGRICCLLGRNSYVVQLTNRFDKENFFLTVRWRSCVWYKRNLIATHEKSVITVVWVCQWVGRMRNLDLSHLRSIVFHTGFRYFSLKFATSVDNQWSFHSLKRLI